ncbi:hypothetical protein BayCH28_17375 [Mycolicibacterium sp. CH28]|nr:hypothetical protein BayCH28_17375 [Mycolicibacterium sp. CH28]
MAVPVRQAAYQLVAGTLIARHLRSFRAPVAGLAARRPFGVQTMCVSGGQGMAMVLERLS